MAAARKSIVFLLVLIAVSTAISTSAEAIGSMAGAEFGLMGRSTCRGTIGECIGGEEFDLGSEPNRRILATSNYISYDSLKRDSVPCSRRGASYYNCRAGASGNPYSRGCSAITKCRS